MYRTFGLCIRTWGGWKGSGSCSISPLALVFPVLISGHHVYGTDQWQPLENAPVQRSKRSLVLILSHVAV